MANELTKSVMAAIVQRLGQPAGYEPIRRTPKQASENAFSPNSDAYSRPGLSRAQENTLKKLIHKDIHLSDQPIREERASLERPVRSEEPSLSQMGKGGVVRLDDLLKALKK